MAPRDELVREIQAVLKLIRPLLPDDPDPAFDGYCGAASEAYLHLSGGRESGLKVKRGENVDGSSHYWLEGSRGVIDLTLGVRDDAGYPYENGKGTMFRNGYDRPSERAAAIIQLVQWRRERTNDRPRV
jgi:hypothetical protein